MSKPWEIWDADRAIYYEETYGTPYIPEPQHETRMKLALSLCEGDSILDVGCGIGHFYPFRGDRYYVGVDSSAAMIEKAKERFPEGNFQHGDAYNLQVPSQDTVISQSLLIHLPDFEAPVREMWSKATKALIFSIPVGRDVVNKWEQFGDKYLLSQSKPLTHIKRVCQRLPEYKGLTWVVEPNTGINNTYFRVSRQ